MTLFAPKLNLSESFASIQGEGKTIGVPSVFWRFQYCGGTCVFCDTAEVWKKGTAYTYPELFKLFLDAGYFRLLDARTHHLIITGGDPLIQQKQIVGFMRYCEQQGEPVGQWFIECENQAELMPSPEFCELIDLWNISPKLANSGMSVGKRIKPDVIRRHVNFHNAIFKFPVATEADMAEVLEFQRSFSIQSGRIYLMPICSTRVQHEEVGAIVAACAMRYGFRFSARLQVVLWDKTTAC